MKDAFGHEIQIGHTVAFKYPNSSRLKIGKVVRLNPKMVRIEIEGGREFNSFPERCAIGVVCKQEHEDGP
jgi:hypothetical protein